MKLKAVLFSATVMLAMHAGTAYADAKNGFSVNAGLVSNNMSATMIATGTPYSYSSSGLSLGLDYQIALSPEFSLSPFLMTSSESTSGALVSGTTAGHGIIGLQLRYWAGDVFVGGHLARYSEYLTNPNIGSVSANGNGWGVVAGWEQPDGGLYVMGQLDSAKVQYVDANVNLSGFRLSAGYRWK